MGRRVLRVDCPFTSPDILRRHALHGNSQDASAPDTANTLIDIAIAATGTAISTSRLLGLWPHPTRLAALVAPMACLLVCAAIPDGRDPDERAARILGGLSVSLCAIGAL